MIREKLYLRHLVDGHDDVCVNAANHQHCRGTRAATILQQSNENDQKKMHMHRTEICGLISICGSIRGVIDKLHGNTRKNERNELEGLASEEEVCRG
jgi:hypothetical protein